jgi:hypothetical protein
MEKRRGGYFAMIRPMDRPRRREIRFDYPEKRGWICPLAARRSTPQGERFYFLNFAGGI